MKKSLFFTETNKQTKINAWEKELEGYFSKKRAFTIESDNIALLVIDLQKYFTDPSSHAYIPSIKTILPSIKKVIQAFRNANRQIFFTRHGLQPQEHKKSIMTRWWKGQLLFTDPMSDLCSEIPITHSDLIIKKSTYDCFYDTNLETALHSLNISQLVITGVHTHLCCETTARAAFCRNFLVWLPIDCLMTYNETLHLNSLKTASHGFAIPTTSEKLFRSLKDE